MQTLFLRRLRAHLTLERLYELFVQIVLIVAGAFIAAFGYVAFQMPFDLAAGGVSGIAILVNHFTGFPNGLFYMLVNIPLFALGFRHLGGRQFLWKTILAVILFSSAIDLLSFWLPRLFEPFPLARDMLLNALYAGVMGGIGGGLIYRAGGTIGGTAILGRIIQKKTGFPLSQVYFYSDGLIILSAGFVFGWELSLYAFLTLFLGGIVSDYVLEGPSSIRSVLIVTDNPQPLAKALIEETGHGVTAWQVVGGYTGETHTMLWCTINRPQVQTVKRVVAEIDPRAFMVIAQGHQALGYGFDPLRKPIAE
ncbi:MAG: YitT family protein [Ardenticatenia bacterium]|nr:MAG: YitT family protein [Ardenticatenia bacterium]